MLSLTANRVYLLCAFLMACSFTVWGQSAMLPLGEIVGRMQAAELDSLSHVAPYRVTRQYVLSGSDQKTSSSRVTAEISFVPPSQKDYSLGAVQGNDRVGKVVRKVLDHEADMTSHAKRVMVSDENYGFVLLGSEVIEGHRCYVLQLTPKRDMSDLIRGTAWVDADRFMIRRMEGQPARSPSWWIKDLRVIVNYGEVLGVWMQLSARATADVRWMGRHVLTAQTLEVCTTTVSAKSLPPGQIMSSHRSQIQRQVAGSAAWVAR